MSILQNNINIKQRSVVNVNVNDYHEEDTDILGNICRTSLDCDTVGGPNMEQEKRIRREIANSNERRRMQSINAGFQSLRTLLPHHEGEKLSKAAILQQTAEYIYNLEQEKTRLLSQNCQLMRQVQQHEGDVPPKKRIKSGEIIITTSNHQQQPQQLIQTSELLLCDEGVGSMSPPQAQQTNNIVEMHELKRQLERERNIRIHLEEQIRTMESQLYQRNNKTSENINDDLLVDDKSSILTIIQPVIVEELVTTDVIQDEQTTIDELDTDTDIEMQLIQADSIPLVGQTETVVCCSPPPPTTTTRIRSPPPTTTTTTTTIISRNRNHRRIQRVRRKSRSISRSRSTSPIPMNELPPRLPSVLEAAIKAEPKVVVEVERLQDTTNTNTTNQTTNDNSRLYVANTSRQNLETIVEAIRHLEGDHLFSDEPPPLPQQQIVPLALTTTQTTTTSTSKSLKLITLPESSSATNEQQTIKVEMNHYLQFHSQQQQQQQSRPGVIVVKQHS